MPPYIIALIIVLASLVLFFVVAFLVNEKVSKSIYGRRGDASISIKYALPSDYPNLDSKKFYFLSNKKARLYGYEYHKKDTKPKAVVLLIHGIGGGHLYLLPLINYLCEQGLMIVAYDQYASGMSEGRRIESMSQGAIDVKYAVRYIEQNYDVPFYVMGHSWGGYAAAQALRYSKRIEKCLSIAGVESEAAMINPKLKLRKLVMFIVKLCNATKFGKYAFYTSYGSFKKTNAKVLYLQGKQDLTVLSNLTGEVYQKKLGNRPNINITILDQKGHAPFVDYESQLKQYEVMSKFGLLGGVLTDINVYIDHVKTSVPDPKVYKLISDFLTD